MFPSEGGARGRSTMCVGLCDGVCEKGQESLSVS